MSKRREQELAQPNEQYLGRTLHRVYAALYNNVPWLAVIAVCLYLPGIVLWAVFALHCKADTFLFLTTIAPVAPETVDGVSNLVNTTLIALITTATCLFMLALVLAIARSVQKAGAAPNSSFPCVRNSPSSYYLYRVFNLGYNFIVFFVNMFIVFLMMGAFLWLVVAYGANLSIKGGVLDAATNGFRPLQQYNLARQNYTTVVSYYEQQVKNTPPCVRNTTWFKGINSSIASILKPPGGNDTSPGNTVLCPQSCLNLGSWATLFKLTSNCICEQTKLYQLQQHSLAVATDAGVALGGLILIYFGSCCMHAYLISERVHAGYDYRKAKRIASRRQQLGPSSSSNDNPSGGADKRPHNGGSGPGGGRGDGGDQGDGAAHHVIAMNGSGYPPDPGPDGFDRSTSTVVQTSSHGQHGHVHHRSNSSSSAHESVARGAAGESRGGSFSAVEDVRALQQAVGAADRSLAGNGHMGVAAGAAAGALAAAAAAAAAAASGSGAPTGTGSFTDTSPFVAVAAEGSLQQQQQQGGVQGVDGFSHLHQQQRLHRHHRVSSGGGSSSSSPISAASRQLQRVPSPLNAGRSAAAAAAGLSTHSSAPGSQGVGGLYLNDSVHGHGHRGSGSRVTDWQQQQQQHHDHIRAASPPASLAAAWSAHGRSESRSSTSSIRDLLSGAIPLDQFGHVPRMGLTPTSSGNAAAAVAAIQQQQQLQRVSVIQEVPGSVSTAAGAAGAGAAAAAAALPAAGSCGGSGGPQKCTHRRDDSQQSNSSSSSYGTVVCHSPRSSEPDNSSSVAQSVLQASAAAAAAPGAFRSGSLGGRAAAGGVAGTLAHQQAAAAVEGADTQVPAAPIAVGATVDGEEALSGSRTGSWSRKQAHRRLPALDFTTAAPALWLAKDGDQQQQQQQMPAEGPEQQQQQQQQQVPAEGPQQQQQQQQLAASTTAGAAPQAQQEHVHADRTSTLASVAAAGAAALAGAGAAAAAHGFASADGGDGGEGGAVDRAARAPVRRHIALDGSSTAQQDFIQHGDVSMQPQEQASPQQQQQQQAARSGDAQQQQQQQQQGLGQIPSMAAVAAMLQPSPEPNKQEQEQQQQQELQQGLQDVASFEAEQQQRAWQRPPYSLLLLPPEQHELMLKQQQQQLQALLQQAQEEEQQQPQQHAWTPHHRQWSTLSLSLAASNSSTGSPGPTGAYLRQPQQQPQLHQQHHHHSYSTPNVAAAAGFGSGVSPQGLGGMGGGFGAGTAAAAAAAGPRASYGSMQRSLVPSLAGLGGPMQQQQQQGGLLPGSFGSSSGGGVRFAGNASANGDDESSPGDGTSSVASRSYAALHTPRSFAAGGTAAGVAGSTAGGSVASSLYKTPQATPHSSPAPLRSLPGRMTPAGNTQSAGGGQYGGQYPGNLFVGGSSGGGGGAAMAGGSSSSSWGQLPQGSMLTTSSSYSGSANAPGYGGGLNNLLMSQASLGTPRSVLSPLGREEVLPLQGSVSGYGLLNPGGVVSSSGVQGSSVLAIPPIPEITPGEGLEIEPVGGPLGANGAAAAAGGGDAGVQQQQQDVVMESPLERRRSGYRSSMRKGLMAYDQYKHRQRYQDALTQPLDPGSELARRYRSRMPAI